jgi:hypothetical protein
MTTTVSSYSMPYVDFGRQKSFQLYWGALRARAHHLILNMYFCAERKPFLDSYAFVYYHVGPQVLNRGYVLTHGSRS